MTLENAIRATVEYFDLLGFPVFLPILPNYLFQWDGPGPGLEELRATIQKMPGVSLVGDYVHLEEHIDLLGRVSDAETVRIRLWERIGRYRARFASCPGLSMAAVVNSLAYGMPSGESDIDLFIVTEKGRLHEVRAWLKLMTQIAAARVSGKKRAGRFCFSFMVSEDRLDLSSLALAFDPHLAYFVATAQPIIGQETYERWLAANSWVKNYLPRGVVPRLERISHEGRQHRSLKLLRPLVRAVSRAELARERRRAQHAGVDGDIVISDAVFKFHEHDRRAEVAHLFRERLDRFPLEFTPCHVTGRE